MKFHLAELCCGGAALTLHYLGARRQVVPYQGSKWKMRSELSQVLSDRGFTELGASTLNDIGPWGLVWRWLMACPEAVVHELRELNQENPKDVFDRLHGHPIPQPSDYKFAAEFLFLQRLSHSGKAVGIKAGRWSSPGFNKTSAYGTRATGRFGEVKPMIPSLIGVIESMCVWTWPEHSKSRFGDAFDVDVYPAGLPRVIYIDPDYASSTGYPNGTLPRDGVVRLARRWAAQCDTTVVVSEAEPVAELVEDGWQATCLRQPPSDNKPFQAKGAEWVTTWPPVRKT